MNLSCITISCWSWWAYKVQRFVIENRAVEQALKSQVSSDKEGMKNQFIDPHDTYDDNKSWGAPCIFDYVCKNNIQNWQSNVTSWSIGCNAYIRLSISLNFHFIIWELTKIMVQSSKDLSHEYFFTYSLHSLSQGHQIVLKPLFFIEGISISTMYSGV